MYGYAGEFGQGVDERVGLGWVWFGWFWLGWFGLS